MDGGPTPAPLNPPRSHPYTRPMHPTHRFQRLAFFTRLLDAAPAAERYRLAAEQIAHAEAQGYDAAWVAQHHFHEHEGGLPSPFVFLAHLAAQTRRIRLGTGIITLPLELPVRVAEDAIVLDLISNNRLELGVGNGGNPSAFAGFELDNEHRNEIFIRNLARLRTALKGEKIPGGDTLYPHHPALADTHLAGHVLCLRRRPRGQGRRRADAVAHPAAPA